jgi:LacI family transcriptional regulator/LacI family repressor for deo operon, udp, cdd, tsx, nupC, and nupG
MSPTIRDVARKAGVGLGTVSRVLNDAPNVRPATRERVQEAIADLEYSPSPIARRLSLGKTLTIATVVPFFTRPSAVERLRGVVAALSGSGYDLIVFDIESPENQDATLRDLTRRGRVDGVLLISIPVETEQVERLRASESQVVAIDIADETIEGFSRVAVDDAAGGRMACQHLIELGHRRIGYIGDPVDGDQHFTSSRLRYRGYRQALDEVGIRFDPAWHRLGQHGEVQAHQLALDMLSSSERPTAIFAASDTQAIGVVEAARELGLRIPEDLSVIGYDDIEIAKYIGLTTVRQHLVESGERGAELLLKTLRGGRPTLLASGREVLLKDG